MGDDTAASRATFSTEVRSVKSHKTHAVLTLGGAMATGALLAGCAVGTPQSAPAASPTDSATTQAASVASTDPTAEPTPEVVADEWSQVVDGVLYQGTEIGPVRIGTDTPGQPPAMEPQLPRGAEAEPFTIAANKYLAYVFFSPMSGEAYWKIFGMSRFGTYRQLVMSDPLPSLDAALAAPYVVDGRTLDRAEYMVYIES